MPLDALDCHFVYWLIIVSLVDSLHHGDLKTFSGATMGGGGIGAPYTIFSPHLTNEDTVRSEGSIPNPQAYMIRSGISQNVIDMYGSHHGSAGFADNQHLSGIVGNIEVFKRLIFLNIILLFVSGCNIFLFFEINNYLHEIGFFEYLKC